MQRTKALRGTIATSQVFERRTAHILLTVIFFAFALYLYSMLSTVSFALHRRSTEAQIRDTLSETAELEGAYLALSESITLETGKELGLGAPRTVAYARETAVTTASLSSHGL